MRQVLAAVAMATVVACGARTPTRLSRASSEIPTTTTTEAPTTTSNSTSTTSTTAPRPRSTSGIQPGMLEAITSCESSMAGATVDVAAVNGRYAAAILHKADTVSHRSLTFANGRWYDGEKGQAACAPEIYEMPQSYPPSSTWGLNGYSVFDTSPPQEASTSNGTIGHDATTLVVAISDSTVTKASLGGGYWLDLVVGAREPGVYCAYDDTGRLLHYAQGGWFSGPPGYTGPTEPPLAPTECPKHPPAVS